VLLLWRQRKMVPLAIADRLRISIDTVAKILRAEGLEIPVYLTTTGPKDRQSRCRHCGQRVIDSPDEVNRGSQLMPTP
jgi:hypothetical protein